MISIWCAFSTFGYLRVKTRKHIVLTPSNRVLAFLFFKSRVRKCVTKIVPILTPYTCNLKISLNDLAELLIPFLRRATCNYKCCLIVTAATYIDAPNYPAISLL